jgi:hypothetical protein
MDRSNNNGTQFLGTAFRLIVISIVVGIVLSALGINASNLLSSVNILARRIYDLGFGAFEGLLGYLLVGGMVVVPIALVAWILGRTRSNRS